MSLKDKMKTYNFWISLASAIVLIVRIIGDKFNFFVDTSLIMDITTGLCSIFVILGILSVPKTKTTESETAKSLDTETTEQDTPVTDNIQSIITNINSSRELLKNMENQINLFTANTTDKPTVNLFAQNEHIADEAGNLTKDETNCFAKMDDKANVISILPNLEENISAQTEAQIINNTINVETACENAHAEIQTPSEPAVEEMVEDEVPTIDTLKEMVEALKFNLETVTHAIDLFTKQQ